MSLIEQLRVEIESINAAGVADLFLSPYVNPLLLTEATRNDGPPLWIVNRSDVYDETLEAMTKHTLAPIGTRAREKLAARHSSLSLLEPPEDVGPFEEVPEYAIEDVLGHPLAPFEAMIYFSRDLNEDVRASSALSLTRRVLEHPPNWDAGRHVKQALMERFSEILITDPSPYVRAYVARIPILAASVVEEAFTKENHDLVRGRLLQNPASTERMLLEAPRVAVAGDFSFAERVRALDDRLTIEQRKLGLESLDRFSRTVHGWHIEQRN